MNYSYLMRTKMMSEYKINLADGRCNSCSMEISMLVVEGNVFFRIWAEIEVNFGIFHVIFKVF